MIPVIFIHQGQNDYLYHSVTKAKKFNKEVLLIGTHNHDAEKFYSIENYWKECDEFKSIYQHMSTNRHDYELFCIQRWFVLKNFMQENNITDCCYVDSDVLLFENINEDYKNYSDYIMSLVFGTCAVVSFITKKALDMFCDYIMNIYSNKHQYNYQEMEAFYKARLACGLNGGVCDMTLLRKFAYQFPNAIGELTHPIDNKVYDHCFNQKDYYYEFHNGLKSINFVDSKPYCVNLTTNKMIQFKSLHFQGDSKKFIKNYV